MGYIGNDGIYGRIELGTARVLYGTSRSAARSRLTARTIVSICASVVFAWIPNEFKHSLPKVRVGELTRTPSTP